MSGLTMPKPDAATLERRPEIVRALNAIVPGEGVISGETEMRPYESDGLTAYRQMPFVVVLPETVEQVSKVLRYCFDNDVKVVPRGAGTSLSGGALPLADGVLMSMMKFNRVLDIDFPNRAVVTQPGVTNLGSPRQSSTRASIMPPIPPRRSHAPSAATSRRIPAACTRSNTG